ncbi:HAMP domain-containing protein [Micromonospora sp. PLK6-60]|uniref:sensor histidine kinase n=1 Tax=Micromonospora sp. PLK6-60 TaxID=2873383 RepID=UPI001CA74CDA|nr:ATP-binding protein [Micromonospora sp. PLK6-60]MBY8871336.1 HAMP domain-containing protein [Micromonospora sp. PLK6-60]
MTSTRLRLRLALGYGALALLVGVAVLTIALSVAGRAIQDQVVAAPGTAASLAPGTTDEQAAAAKARAAAAETTIRRQYDDAVRRAVLRNGALAVAVLLLTALAVGWYVAGATLRPLAVIIGSARRIADQNLHERIDQPGRGDEWDDLVGAMNAMLGRIDEAFTAQRQFIGNASHELKTPLAINRTLLEVAMARPGASPDLIGLGTNLLAVNDRHETLVDGLLTLARADHRVLAPRPLNLAETVEQVAEFLRPEADGQRVAVAVAAENAVVEGDAVLLERLVQNLVRNGIRHNEPAGWVRVELARVDGDARLVVANSGPVVPAGAVPQLFEPFTRVAGRVGSARGIGLGLSIVRAVVRAHDGVVTVSARPEGGLLVEVRLRSLDISD